MLNLNANQYLDLVRRSGLIDESRLNKLLAGFDQLDQADSGIVGSTLIEAGLLTNWQSSMLKEGKCRGFFLGRYKLLGQLGKGGMGHVYLAEHTTLKRRVAIKVLQKRLINESSFLERFYLEAQAAAALDHPNIVRCYDADEVEGTHYFVMQYIDGESLHDLVHRSGPLEPHLAAEYTRQAALGLEHAHKAGIVHRDIKPANLLVDSAGVVKVLDLGLARVQDDSRGSLTVAYDDRVIGTIDFQAPEQAIDCHNVDARADIYSLGCTLYFLLTGTPPFYGGPLAQRMLRHQTMQAKDIRSIRPEVPQALVDICRKMMAKSPANRYQTAAELAAALGTYLKPNTTSEMASVVTPTSSQATSFDGELGLAPDKDLPAVKAPIKASPPPAAADTAEPDLSESVVAAQPSGLSDLLDEVLKEPAPAKSSLPSLDSATGALPSASPSPWTTSARSHWSDEGEQHSSRKKHKQEVKDGFNYPLWLLIGAGVLLGVVILLIAYSAISSFHRQRPPTTIEYKTVD